MVLGGDSSENQKSLEIPVATPSRKAGPKSVHPLCSFRLTPPPLGSGRGAPLPFAGSEGARRSEGWGKISK